MAASAEPALAPAAPLRSALLPATVGAVAGVALGTFAEVIEGLAAACGLAGFAAGAVLVARYWSRATLASPGFGAANGVTLLRVVGTSWAAALTAQALLGDLSGPGQVLLVVVGTSCLVLDGVDGRLARTRGEVSAFGARFDVETDAALLLLLSLAVSGLGITGWWVLAVGGLRYGYVATSWVLPALRVPLPFRYVRKVVAVGQAVALLAALALDLWPGSPRGLPTVLALLALAALCWSFGRDVVWQLRHR